MGPGEVFALARDRTAGWLETLEELVSIDSPSSSVEGVVRISAQMIERWSRLGLEVEQLSTRHGPAVVGRRRVGSHAPRLLLVGHLDTVFPSGTAAQRGFQVADGRALGPGVADAKGGLVVMLAAYELAMVAGGGEDLNVTVILNGDEEIGSPGSRDVISELARGAAVALIFEPGRPDGSFVIQRGGSRRYRLETHGRAAHTGVDPSAGASAIVALSEKVLRLTNLTDAERGVLVNVGVIDGGTRANVVPDRASALVDVRYPDLDTLAGLEARMHSIAMAVEVAGTSGDWTMLTDRPPMVPGDLTRRLASRYQEFAGQLNIIAKPAASAGGSDGNFTAAVGAATLDAVGPVGGGFHTADEYMVVSSLTERAVLAAMIICGLQNLL